MFVEKSREVDLPNGGHLVTSDKTSFIYGLTNGHQLQTSGTLRVQFDQPGKIDILEILTTSHEEFLPRAQLLQAAADPPELKQSPNISKTSSKKAAQQRQKQAQAALEQSRMIPVPNSTVNDQGVTPSVQQFLEVRLANFLPAFSELTVCLRLPKQCHLCSRFSDSLTVSPDFLPQKRFSNTQYNAEQLSSLLNNLPHPVTTLACIPSKRISTPTFSFLLANGHPIISCHLPTAHILSFPGRPMQHHRQPLSKAYLRPCKILFYNNSNTRQCTSKRRLALVWFTA